MVSSYIPSQCERTQKLVLQCTMLAQTSNPTAGAVMAQTASTEAGLLFLTIKLHSNKEQHSEDTSFVPTHFHHGWKRTANTLGSALPYRAACSGGHCNWPQHAVSARTLSGYAIVESR